MTTFDERERAFEAKHALDAEMMFRVESRSLKGLAFEVAHRIGRADSVEYARELMAHWLTRKGLDHVFARILADAAAAGVALDEAALRREHAAIVARVKAEMMASGEN